MSILNAPEGLIKLLVRKYELFDVSISEDFGKRMSICSTCPSEVKELLGVNVAPFCKQCSCVIEAKCLIKVEKCPSGNW